MKTSAAVLALSCMLVTPAFAGPGKRPIGAPAKAMKAAAAAAAAAVTAELELEPIQIGDVDPTAGLAGEAALYAAFAAAPAVVAAPVVAPAAEAPEIVFDADSVAAEFVVTAVVPAGVGESAPIVAPATAPRPFGFEERHHRAQLSEIDPGDDEPRPVLAKKPLRALSSTIVDQVIQAKYADQLEYCWMQIPAAARAIESASIHFTISPQGTVSGADLDGDLPAALGSCVLKVAAQWTFPAAHAETEIDHMLRFATK